MVVLVGVLSASGGERGREKEEGHGCGKSREGVRVCVWHLRGRLGRSGKQELAGVCTRAASMLSASSWQEENDDWPLGQSGRLGYHSAGPVGALGGLR